MPVNAAYGGKYPAFLHKLYEWVEVKQRMTLRKKLAVTTLAASVAVSAMAGLPLSRKGLAEKMGFTQTTSAASGAGADFIDQAFYFEDTVRHARNSNKQDNPAVSTVLVSWDPPPWEKAEALVSRVLHLSMDASAVRNVA